MPPPPGTCSLTYLDGYVPMGWDGVVDAGGHPSELRFRVTDSGRVADRRSSVRVPVAEMWAQVSDGETAVTARVLDVSAGGMRVRRGGWLEKGTVVRVRAELPGGPVIDADAVVRGTEPGICSLEYVAHRGAGAAEIGGWAVDALRHALFTPA
jgi:hypothetical protein